MTSEDKSNSIVICALMTCLLIGYMFDGTITYLERERDIQQQRLEIKQRQIQLQDSELRAQLKLHCLGRTDISGDAKSKECWDEL